jgi:hypothetical protein
LMCYTLLWEIVYFISRKGYIVMYQPPQGDNQPTYQSPQEPYTQYPQTPYPPPPYAPQPTRPAREGRTEGTVVAIINLLLGVSLLLCMLALCVFIKNIDVYCGLFMPPWWFTLAGFSSLILIPGSIIEGIYVVSSKKKEYRGLPLSLSNMNFILAGLLILVDLFVFFVIFTCEG